MYPGFEAYECQKAQAKLGLKPWLKWPSEIKERERKARAMEYQDQLAIGNAFNQAIQRVLSDYGISYIDQPGLVSAIAQAILVTLDQANYQIVRK